MTDLRKAAKEALEAMLNFPDDISDEMFESIVALRAALAQQEEPMQEQVIEDAIEAAYWHFDARKKGLNEWAYAPQSERDAFKAEARKLVRGYFPTRQAQDTKREMLAVADAFIRGKRAVLAQQAEPVAEVFVRRDGVSFAFWLKAPPPERTKLYTAPPQRLPLTEEVATLTAQRDALLEALKELTPPMPPADAPCHVGLVPQEKCAHCGRIARARAAIKAVEETK